jgi:hypothetical protein
MKRLWPGSIAEIEQPKQNPAGPCFQLPLLGAVESRINAAIRRRSHIECGVRNDESYA